MRTALLLLLICISSCDANNTVEEGMDPIPELAIRLEGIGYGETDTTMIHITNQSEFDLYFFRCCSHIQMGMQRFENETWISYPVGLQKPCGAFCPHDEGPISPDSIFTDKAVLRHVVRPGLHRLVVEYWSDNPSWKADSLELQPYGSSVAYSPEFVVAE